MITNLFARIPVAERDASLDWYERLAGRAPDLVPNDQEACWQLAPGAWIYILTDPSGAGSGYLTMLVEDLEGLLGDLASRGIEAGPIRQIGKEPPTALLSDPDGNRIKFGQDPLTG